MVRNKGGYTGDDTGGEGGPDSEVGYGKPPRHHRFKKGQSGNPKGRPRGSTSFATLARRELDHKITITEGGRSRQITKREAGAKQLANRVALGDPKALQQMMNNPLFKDEQGLDPEEEKSDEAFKVIAAALDELASYKQRYGHLDRKEDGSDAIQNAQEPDSSKS